MRFSTEKYRSFHENILCGYTLEVPHQDTSKEYPQYINVFVEKEMLWG